MPQKIIYWNFVFVIWLIVGLLVYRCYDNFFVQSYESFRVNYYHKAFSYYIAPLVSLIIYLVIWYRFYRVGHPIGKILAFITGVFILIACIIIPFLSADISAREFNSDLMPLWLYLMASNFAYPFFYKSETITINFY